MIILDDFERQIFREIDSVARGITVKPLVLNGVPGSGGGVGGPIGGIIGQLRQNKVTFDTSELTDGIYPDAATSSLVDNLNRIRGGWALGDGSIKARHLDSGILNTMDVTDGSATVADVSKIRFLNSIVSGDPSEAVVEIIAVTSGYYSLPDMSGHEGQFLTNNGFVPYWDVSLGQVTTVFGRNGDVIASGGDYTWDQIDKTVSSLIDITTRSHNDLSEIGTFDHADIDHHINDQIRHVPDITGEVGTMLFTDGNDTFWVVPSGYGHIIQKDLIDFPQQSKLNFTGNVTVTDDPTNNTTTVDISSSGGSGGGHIILADGTPVTVRPNLNFSSNFSVTDDSGLDATTIDVVVDPDTLASVAEANAGVITDKAVTPAGLPLRVEHDGLGSPSLIYNQPYGGDARGANAIDLQINRTNSNEVASGSASTIIGGADNRASGTDSTVIGGNSNVASADGSVVVGGSFGNAISRNQIVSGTGGLGQGTIQLVVGYDIDHTGETGWLDLLEGSYHVINVPEDTLWTLSVLVSAADESLTNCASYQILGSLRNIGGVVEILGSTVTAIYEDIADWNIRLGTYSSPYEDQLSIQVTDGLGESYIRWVVTLRISETYFPAGA